MLEALREAELRDPRSYSVVEGLSSYYYNKRRYDSALVYARRMIELAPTRPSGYLVAGTCCRCLADYAGAETFLNDFLRIAPEHPQAAEVREMLRAKN
jgi:tetratricopeptide (TPR) repeat protein